MAIGVFRTAMIAGAFAAMALPALGQSVEYRGGGFVGEPTGCEAHGWGGLTQFTARYLPVGRGQNTDASLSFYFGDYAMNYRFPQDLPANVWANITEFGAVGDNVFVWLPNPAPRIRFLMPPVVTTIEADHEIHALLEFQHFNGLQGCTIRGEIWLRRLS